MNGFENKVLNFIRENELLVSSDKVLIGFSGGADSTALITVLYELRKLLGIELCALHVNHGIRPEAGEDASFTRDFCKERGVEYILVEENVPLYAKENKLTEEEAGRKLRYEAFESYAQKTGATKIAVAHHQNDAAETLLHNLMRGSGLHGAGAIRPKRDNIIRPLLCVSRLEIEEYLKEKELSFCTDSTNEENIHTRNKIRNVIIPYAEKEINEGAAEHLSKAAEKFARADDYIRSVAKDFFEKEVVHENDSIELDINKLNELPGIIKENVILLCFEQLTPNRKDITSLHVEALINLANDTEGTKRKDFPYLLTAIRQYNILIISKKNEKDVAGSYDDRKEIEILKEDLSGGEKVYEVPGLGTASVSIMKRKAGDTIPSDTYTKWFDCDRIQTTVFRRRKKDDYIYIEMDGKDCKKMLSKFMTDVKIPANERDELYVLADGDHVLWVPGYRMSSKAKISEDTESILAINIIFGGKNSG
ncbi:tRNA lysidine(34) synthetase TilS [Butyrivibrio sp. X503]|uniref:tRNA lysidine(34) synthetase TilS n=1 Tax=Butyrivibrio sp. X503 TaxID=2364878 RepID=UPI000EA88C14|nr:tRNA lysidine(34) synthetase TilS [Butyrivibrio sp. X503]RKM54883.1 tRNA lysidine(34) synthetase TilS [Butyrivibrio sp. X503]